MQIKMDYGGKGLIIEAPDHADVFLVLGDRPTAGSGLNINHLKRKDFWYPCNWVRCQSKINQDSTHP